MGLVWWVRVLLQAFRTYSQRFVPAVAIGRHLSPVSSPRVGIPKQARWGILLVLLLAVVSLLFTPESVFANDPPAKPAGFTVAPGNQEATLSWDDPGDSSIIRYEFFQTSNTVVANVKGNTGQTGNTVTQESVWTPIPGSDASTTSYTVSPLTNYETGNTNRPDVLYTFRVRAVNNAADGTTEQPGPPSDSVTTNPGLPLVVPTGLGASWNTVAGELTLAWDEHPYSVETEFEVSWRNLTENGGEQTKRVQFIASPETPATGTEIAPGISYGNYEFKVRARYNLGALVSVDIRSATEHQSLRGRRGRHSGGGRKRGGRRQRGQTRGGGSPLRFHRCLLAG